MNTNCGTFVTVMLRVNITKKDISMRAYSQAGVCITV